MRKWQGLQSLSPIHRDGRLVFHSEDGSENPPEHSGEGEASSQLPDEGQVVRRMGTAFRSQTVRVFLLPSFVGEIEAVVEVRVFLPPRAFIGAALGAGLGTGRDVFTADGADGGRLHLLFYLSIVAVGLERGFTLGDAQGLRRSGPFRQEIGGEDAADEAEEMGFP